MRKIEHTREELLAMREAGMTNRDIADTLHIAIGTVRKYIGPQPGKNWHDYIKRREAEPFTAPRQNVEPKPEPVNNPAARLVVTNRTIKLTGEIASYTVDAKDAMVMIEAEDGLELLNFDDLKKFTDELQAIVCHLDGLRVTPEMW